MNELKYGFVNGDSIVGLVYESDKYGRTLVVLDKLDANFSLQLMEVRTGEKIFDIDLIDFLQSMIPMDTEK